MVALNLGGNNNSSFLSFRGRQRSSFFCRAGKETRFLKAGTEFTRNRKDKMVETARVLAVSSDSFGIPHIRYELEIKRPSAPSKFFDGPRVLALSTFLETYQQT